MLEVEQPLRLAAPALELGDAEGSAVELDAALTERAKPAAAGAGLLQDQAVDGAEVRQGERGLG